MLTDHGEVFLKRSQAILGEVRKALEVAATLSGNVRKTLRLGIPPFLGAWILPTIFTDYASKHPKVALVVNDLGTREIHDQLIADELDLGLIVMYEKLTQLECLTVSQGELQLIMPIDHRLGHYDAISFEQLEKENIIMQRPGTFTHARVMQEFEKYGLIPNILHSPLQLATMLNMVSYGAGVAFVLDDSVSLIKDMSTLMVRPLKQPIFYEAALAWRKDRSPTQAMIDFLHFFRR